MNEYVTRALFLHQPFLVLSTEAEAKRTLIYNSWWADLCLGNFPLNLPSLGEPQLQVRGFLL